MATTKKMTARDATVGQIVDLAVSATGAPGDYIVREHRSGHVVLAELDWERGEDGDEIAASDTEMLVSY